MTNEIIDKYLDQQGITSGEWEHYRQEETDYIIATNKGYERMLCEAYSASTSDFVLTANSRKSLRDWIIVAYRLGLFSMGEQGTVIYSIYTTATENIESSLGKPWSQVQEELEEVII